MHAQGFAQTSHMYIYGARIHKDIASPNSVEQLLTRPNASGLFHEMTEQPKLSRTELDFRTSARDFMGFTIKDNVFKDQLCATARAHGPSIL